SGSQGSKRGGGGQTFFYSSGGQPFSQYSGREEAEEEENTDIAASLPIPAKLAQKGGEAKFKLSNGRAITLKIPAGTKEGQKMRLKGEGNKCPYCRHHGDLIVKIKIK
ncbi:MAG: DnaJ C-terminal domain-containing protein, partial [Candidatus Omnitrophica bacterium]|nr:DnaJ C-terminal domain-containing protein [Candidatus Omnitrophota bacterium]